MKSRLANALKQVLGEFRRSNRGNVAMMFAVTLIPMLAATGMVVDYSRAAMARTQMQDALDAAALYISNNAATPTMSQSQLNATALALFDANFVDTDAKGVTVTPSYSAAGPTVTIAGSATVTSDFMNVVGITQMPISATSTVVWGHQRLRVALVLDNTGSMAADGKIDALKTATQSLLTQLKGVVTTAGDVYVSVIPFSRDVNVGSSNTNATWIDWTGWDANNGSCSKSGYSPQSSCTAQFVCSKSQYTSSSQCTSHNGTWAAAKWTAANHNTWNGCVQDRGTSASPGTAAGYDQKIDAPVSGNVATLFPADQFSSCTLQMMGLSYDWTSLSSLVNQMTPNGSTNQPIGLAWGWQSLVGGGPLTAPAFDPAYKYKQVIILLSDGLNTQDRWYGNGSTTDANVDARMYSINGGGTISGTCQNAKDAGIILYTVQVNTGGDPTSTLLQNCASDPSQFFMLTSASQIITTFQSIGTALSDLRLSS